MSEAERKSVSLLDRTYSKEDILNRDKPISVVNTDVRANSVNIKNATARVIGKTRKLIAALPRRLKSKE